MNNANKLFFASGDGQPFEGSYGLFISYSPDHRVSIVACGCMLLTNDAGRDDVLNEIVDSKLRGIRIDCMRFVVVPEIELWPLIGFEFKIMTDLNDFCKKGGKSYLYSFRRQLIPRWTVSSTKVRGGSCRLYTHHDEHRVLSPSETLADLTSAGIALTPVTVRRAYEARDIQTLAQ